MKLNEGQSNNLVTYDNPEIKKRQYFANSHNK